jgi:uncharacterized protein YjbI with pentapeptide repeats
MNEKLAKYVDGVFSQYEDEHAIRELKEELKTNLQERWNDLKGQGYDDDTAYKMTIDSIGDIAEAVQSVAGKTKEQKEMVNKNLSLMQLEGSDLRGIRIHDGKFNYSSLKGADFSNSDLTNSSFLSSDLTSVKFDGANLTGAKFNTAALKGASFDRCVLTQTHFHTSDLSGVRLENLTLEGTIFEKTALDGTSFKNSVLRNVSFRNTKVRKAIFDGATMDKVTYAVLKGYGANLTNVTVF